MLTMENVTKRYKHRRSDVYALQDANVEIGTGEFVSIVGPSGSGKSTLLLMLGGMLAPSFGKVELQGTSLYDLSPNERARMRKQHVGFVFQSFNLVPYLTARENVMIPLFLSGAAKDVQESRATELLERVGLGDRLDRKPSELRIGQQQRVGQWKHYSLTTAECSFHNNLLCCISKCFGEVPEFIEDAKRASKALSAKRCCVPAIKAKPTAALAE